MNCRNLETIITELARGQMLEARVKEDAIIHMEACKLCASRFADEQSLTAGLRTIAARAAGAEAPLRVEAALLSAFRQGTATPFVQGNMTPHTKALPWLPWSIAAAAAILIFSVFGLPRLLPNASRTGVEQEARNGRPAAVASSATGTMPDSGQNEPGIQLPNSGINPYEASAGGAPVPRSINRRRASLQAAALRNKPAQPSNSFGTTVSAAASDEITTEFLPISYGSNLSQLDDGQVVRVELPRSALQSFGLPVNAERAGERVKADVLLGHDGVARAIRFVR
jgi:hypothetical protein